MSRYALKLPVTLKQEAENLADVQGVSLNQFIVWAVSEKVGGLKQQLHDPRFRHVEYRIGASGWPMPVVRGTGIRVQTLAIAAQQEDSSVRELADEFSLTTAQVEDALAFYAAHRRELDRDILSEELLEPTLA